MNTGPQEGSRSMQDPEDREAEVLRTAYGELEREARDYADPVRAVTAARRRRAGRTAAGAVLAAAAVAGVVGLAGYGPWAPGETGPATGATASATASVTASVTTGPTAGPITVRPPASAPPLPEGGAGAAGLLIYTSCVNDCPTYLLTADGRQYLLGGKTAPPPGNLTLSPDGRWLGRPTGTGYELRDLVGGAVHTVDAPRDGAPGAVYSPWTWSADGRRLVLGHHASGEVGSYAEVNLADGRTTALTPDPGFEPVGMLTSGEPLLFEESRYGERATRVALAAGTPGRRITLDAGSTPLVSADGGPSIQVRGERIYAVAPDLTAVVVFGADGGELARLRLKPGETPLAPEGDGFAVLTGSRLERWTASGSRTPLYDLPQEALTVLPGQARH
ncbi:hypothetical protein ACFFMN_01520 [Planobispora siamensis]|uniref:Uncharacterized protein n=1 Tax=Planobispora siamensis TaxID=936338 RepID=A0A8J3SM29_9ACTN|nr:hypothetical protein [Planobispora siamensis]GIH95700.1 hypothetical protein Psi01_63300 [Planobispora siamensis]